MNADTRRKAAEEIAFELEVPDEMECVPVIEEILARYDSQPSEQDAAWAQKPLLERIANFARHDDDCLLVSGSYPCSCGLAEVEKEIESLPEPAAEGKDEPHVWTHHAEHCDEDGCTHRQVRTCAQAEQEKKFLRRIIDGLRDRLYKADPNAAWQDWNRLMRALDKPDDWPLASSPSSDPK